ncbi:MAG: hypothetical protein QXJ83_03085 [Sulfolobales archaeon]
MNPCPEKPKQLKQPKTLANGHGQPLPWQRKRWCARGVEVTVTVTVLVGGTAKEPTR